MSKLRDTLSQTWLNIQSSLFPWLSEELGLLTEKQQELVTTLEVVRIEEFIYSSRGFPGRPKRTSVAVIKFTEQNTCYGLHFYPDWLNKEAELPLSRTGFANSSATFLLRYVNCILA